MIHETNHFIILYVHFAYCMYMKSWQHHGINMCSVFIFAMISRNRSDCPDSMAINKSIRMPLMVYLPSFWGQVKKKIVVQLFCSNSFSLWQAASHHKQMLSKTFGALLSAWISSHKLLILVFTCMFVLSQWPVHGVPAWRFNPVPLTGYMSSDVITIKQLKNTNLWIQLDKSYTVQSY